MICQKHQCELNGLGTALSCPQCEAEHIASQITMTNPAPPVDDARAPTMQERAAKVAEGLQFAQAIELPDGSKWLLGSMQANPCDAQKATALGIAKAIRALSPDPTRAALEECVRAMERAMQRSNESGTGTLSLVDTIHAVHGILREAYTGARNALQGE